MKNKTFKTELDNYENFLKSNSNFLRKAYNAMDYKKYGLVILNTLKNRYLKEHQSENNLKFIKNIFVMKCDLKQIDFESVEEIENEILEDLDFLRRNYDA